MISLETAKALKAAGLVWEPQYGDRFVIPAIFIEGLSGLIDDRLLMAYRANEPEDNWEEFIRVNIFLPWLDQILAEIERRGYEWSLWVRNKLMPNKYTIDVGKATDYGETKRIGAYTPDEAAAQALLWILRQKEV